MPKRPRRSQSETLALVLKLTKSGPVTPQVLASELRVSGNRARQILEALRDDDRLEIVGKTQGGRGKPANIYGVPGTKVTAAGAAQLAGRKATGKRGVSTGMVSGVGAEGSAIDALLNAIATRGLEVVGPGGITFTVRFATGAGASAPVGRTKRKYTRRKPKIAPGMKKAVKSKASVAVAKSPLKTKVSKKPIKTSGVKRSKAVPTKRPAPKSAKAAPKVQKTAAKKPAPVKVMKKASAPPAKKVMGPKALPPKKPKLELITPQKKSEAESAEAAKPAATPEVTPPAPGSGV